jgi:putative transposon-encoded protein
MANDKNRENVRPVNEERRGGKVKFEIYGEEMIEKLAKRSGSSSRVYLPSDWVGSRVKVIRID